MAHSLRLVSVVICVILTLVTAVLTLAVSMSFTTKAVDDIGQRYSSSLATNLKANVASYLQRAVDQYYSMAQFTSSRPTGPPNSTWSAGWNGSFWTFNTNDFGRLDSYYAMMLQTMLSHNFTRESSAMNCFVDGTMLQVTFNAFVAGGGNYYKALIAGKPDGRPINATSMTYNGFQFYGSNHKPYPGAPDYFNTKPAGAWAVTSTSGCTYPATCTTADCRLAPQFKQADAFGPQQCFWLPMQVSVWPSIATGVFCTMFNSLDQRLGITGSLMQLTAVTKFVSETQRTANGQAFVVNSADSSLLGSTYTLPYQGAWKWGNASFDSVARVFRNNSAFPITLTGMGTSTMDRPENPFPGAIAMNSTYLKVKPNCLLGFFIPYIVCQETVSTYGYAPLSAVQQAVGFSASAGFRQGSVVDKGATYYYAIDGISTFISTSEVSGLGWAVVVLTPQQDVLGEVTKGRSYSIIATCAFFVFAALCCYILFSIFLRPLVDLEDKMLLTANFADDSDTSEEVSALSEIQNMQKSFYKMRAQLRKLKSFVPQSVLATLDDDDDDEDAAVTTADGTNQKSVRVADYESERSANENRTQVSRRNDGTHTETGSSRSKRSSGKHSVVTGSGIVVRGLNMQLGLVKKVVSIIVFNVVGMHAAIKPCNVDEVTALHSKLVESFNAIVSSGKGIVDSFQGDRFVATFNAVTSNAQHAVRAAVAAQEVLAAFTRQRTPFARAAVGIATGDALVGNGGCETMRRFCTIGRVYTQATVMERLTKLYPTADALLTQGTASQLAHEFYLEALDVVQLEGQGKPTLVYALRERMNHAMEEWNYAMQQNEAKDKYSKLNEAFASYCEGDPTQARAVLASVPDTARQCPGYTKLNELLQNNVSPTQEATSSQGKFFHVAFGGAE